MAHNMLNQAIQKGLKVSILASAVLRNTSEQPQILPLKPVIDVSTRWNSTYDMLEQYLHVYP